MSTKVIGFVSLIRALALVDRLRGSFPAERREAMKGQIQRPLVLHRIVTAFCLLLAVGLTMALAVPPMAHASLDQDINLGYANLSQIDPRWMAGAIGANQDVNVFQCGSFLAVLSTLFENALQATPWFSIGIGNGGTIEVGFNPIYLDTFLRMGPAAQSEDFEGYKPGAPGTCAVSIRPYALQFVGVPPRPEFPTGVLLRRKPGFGADVRKIIDDNLLANWPTIVILGLPPDEGGGFHPQLIVGWSNEAKAYLVLDPFQSTGGHARFPTLWKGNTQSYANWEESVVAIIDAVKAWESTYPADLLSMDDDPAPIEFLVTTPDGRRVGFDPTTGSALAEDDTVFPLEVGGWTDMFGGAAPGDPAKFLAVRHPAAGTYRLSVIGTATGPAAFTISRGVGATRTVLETFNGTVTPGTVLKYEARLAGPGAPTLTRVTNFTPEAKAGNRVRGIPGVPVQLNGSQSFDADGTIVSYVWDFGDGATGAGSQVSHAYAAAGTYTATLTVTDDQGASGTGTTTVIISESSPSRDFGTPINVNRNVGGSVTPQLTVADGHAYVGWVGAGTTGQDIFVAASGDNGASFLAPVVVASPALDPFNRFGPELRLAASGSRVYAVWQDFGSNGEPDVLLKVSTDNGATFGPPINLSNSAGTSSEPRIAVSGDHVYVVWTEYINFTAEIFLRASADGGATFGPAVNLSQTAFRHSFEPDLAAVDSHVYVVWRENVPFATDIFFTVSADHGASFSAPVNLSVSGLVDEKVSSAPEVVAGIGSTVAVLWNEQQMGSTFRISADSGATFGPAIGTRDVTAGGATGRIAVSGSRVHVVAVKPSPATPGQFDIFFSVSPDNGATFGAPVQLNLGSAGGAGIAAFGNHVYVTWVEVPGPTSSLTSLLFAASTDGGATFGDAFELANGSLSAASFPLKASGGTAYVAWSDASLANVGIFVNSATFAQPAKPIANASGPYLGWATSSAVPAAISFDGSKSLDPGGRALAARWDFGDGTPPLVVGDIANPVTHAYASPGQYTVTLVVNNGTANSEPATTTVDVFPALPPDGVVVTPFCAAPGAAVRVSGSVAPLALVQRGWNLSQGPLVLDPVTVDILGTAQTAPLALAGLSFETAFALPAGLPPGSYPAAVPGGPTTTFAVPCPPPDNRPPAPNAGGPYAGRVGQAITFDGSRSTDPEGAPLNYAWDFGDRATGSGARPQHAYAKPGTYIATLVVSDGTESSFPTVGTRSFAMVTVTADPTPPPPPPPPPARDTTPPATVASPTPGPNANGWNRGPVAVALSATDNPGGSGVKEIHFTLSGASSSSQVVAGSSTTVGIATEGATTLTYFAIDNAGNQEAAKALTVRIDQTAPTVTGLPSSCSLWPPNHALVQVASVSARDGLSGLASPLTVTVTSNEPDNGTGDGDMAGDIVISGGRVQVRSERVGSGSGRIYTITATASDVAGNTTTQTATCKVPHDDGRTAHQ